MEKKVSILIPTRFNSRWVIDLCLKTIRKYTDYPYQIIIGDAGVESETLEFLRKQEDIQIFKCPDPLRPKDFLARVVETPYFLFLHDDVQILKKGWLERRVSLIEKNNRNGIIGLLAANYISDWRKNVFFYQLNKRFLPLVMLVRNETQKELDLCWGKLPGFDTGGVAYLQFVKQNKWKFVPLKFDNEIKHWGRMTWVVRKKMQKDKTDLDLDKLLGEREKKISLIKKVITENAY